jgi:hypothetical protein
MATGFLSIVDKISSTFAKIFTVTMNKMNKLFKVLGTDFKSQQFSIWTEITDRYRSFKQEVDEINDEHDKNLKEKAEEAAKREADLDKKRKQSSLDRDKGHNDNLTGLKTEWNLESIDGWIAHRDQMKDLLSEEQANELIKNQEFHEMMIEATNEERTQILENLTAFQITKKELEDQDTIKKVKKRMKDRNDEIKFEQKHNVKLVGMMKAYYKTMKFLDNSRLKEAGQFASQFNAMASSSNKELREIAKVGANVQIVADTAVAARSAMTGAVSFFGIPYGPIIGAVLAAAQIAFGVEQIHRLNSQKLADGGIVSGGIKGIDSVPAMLMPGELVIPQKDANDALNSIGASRDEEVFGNDSTTQIIIGFDGEEASQVLTARQIENQALGISREEAA